MASLASDTGTPNSSTSSPELYPVFLKLAGRRVLVVGGGVVASSKLPALLATGALVTVVAPHIRPEMHVRSTRCLRRQFRDSDLDGVWFVVAAATPFVNRQVGLAARKRCVFVNAVDDSERATAFLGGVVRRGGVTVAISTQGRVAALAGMLREALQALLPDELEQWVRRGEAARLEWKANAVPHDQRRPLLLRILNDLYAQRDGSGHGDAENLPRTGEDRTKSRVP